MERITLPKTFDGLVDFVEDLAEQIGRGDFRDFKSADQAEETLRADLAAATYVNRAYLAILRGAGESTLAHRFLEAAWYKRDRIHARLRQDAREILDDLYPPFLDHEEWLEPEEVEEMCV
jgi:hypothetical protein